MELDLKSLYSSVGEKVSIYKFINMKAIFRVLVWVILRQCSYKEGLFEEICRKRKSQAKGQRQRVQQEWRMWTKAPRQEGTCSVLGLKEKSMTRVSGARGG